MVRVEGGSGHAAEGFLESREFILLAFANRGDLAFSAGDLIMVSVLLRLKSSGILDEYPNLGAYVARGEARPANRRAFEAQLAANIGKPPTG